MQSQHSINIILTALLYPNNAVIFFNDFSACQDEIHTALLLTSHNATALSLTVLAVCHAVATFHPLSYERLATQRRVWIVVNVIWIAAILFAHIHFLAVLTHFQQDITYCEQVGQNTRLPLIMSVTLTATLVLVTGCIYARVLLSLRPLRNFSPDTGTTNPPKSIRGVITGMLLNLTYLICWLPWIITRFCSLTSDPSSRSPDDTIDLQIGLKACQVLILLNALCNPLIYGSRGITMQTAYLTLYHRIRGRVRVTWYKCLGKEFAEDLPSTPLNPIESICWWIKVHVGINLQFNWAIFIYFQT